MENGALQLYFIKMTFFFCFLQLEYVSCVSVIPVVRAFLYQQSGLEPCLTIVAVTQKLLGPSHIDLVRSKYPSGFQEVVEHLWPAGTLDTGHISAGL